MSSFIRVVKDGETLSVHPTCVEDHESVGWSVVADPLDHDHDGRKGGSTKQASDDLVPLRAAYQDKFGKRPFMGWDAETIRAKIEAARG